MTNNFEKTWMQASETLRTMVNPDLFNLWFDPIQPSSINEETAVLLVPNEFCAVWLKDNYLELLQDVLAHITGKKLNVQLEINKNIPDEVPTQKRDIARNAATVNPQPAKRTTSTQSRASSEKLFNPKNTFSTFVVGDNNNFALAAALAVAQSPGRSYNPLFLYGGVGLGKTHLLHAIGHNVLKENSKLKDSYLSSEKFTN